MSATLDLHDAAATSETAKRELARLLAIEAAAQAVVARWDTPRWKDVPATAEYINRLRNAIAHNALGHQAGAKAGEEAKSGCTVSGAATGSA